MTMLILPRFSQIRATSWLCLKLGLQPHLKSLWLSCQCPLSLHYFFVLVTGELPLLNQMCHPHRTEAHCHRSVEVQQWQWQCLAAPSAGTDEHFCLGAHKFACKEWEKQSWSWGHNAQSSVNLGFTVTHKKNRQVSSWALSKFDVVLGSRK